MDSGPNRIIGRVTNLAPRENFKPQPGLLDYYDYPAHARRRPDVRRRRLLLGIFACWRWTWWRHPDIHRGQNVWQIIIAPRNPTSAPSLVSTLQACPHQVPRPEGLKSGLGGQGTPHSALRIGMIERGKP